MPYYVTMTAGYLHGVWGPFDTYVAAVEFADSCALDPEEDGHHSYNVVRKTSYGITDEHPEPIYTVSGAPRGYDYSNKGKDQRARDRRDIARVEAVFEAVAALGEG